MATDLDLNAIDVPACTREECEALLAQLRDLFRREQSESRKLEVVRLITQVQKRLTQLRIDNIRRMIRV